jgi:hypothetical protein
VSYDIFLSYCREDEGVAKRFAQLASTRGLNVWYDEMISGGQDWRQAIVAALQHSDALLILFSEGSNRSTELIKEIAIADRLGKLVIPVLIQDTEPRGPYLYEMASRNWINLHPDPHSRLGSLVDRLIAQLHNPVQTHVAAPDQSVPEYVNAAPRSDTGTRGGGPSVSAAPAPISLPASLSWFPARRYDLVLGLILVVGFILEMKRPQTDDSGLGIVLIALIIYMFILAWRNAKLNRGAFSPASFCSYLLVGLLVLPFALLPNWLADPSAAHLAGTFGVIAAGFFLCSIVAALIANVMQVIMRKVILQGILRRKIGTPLAKSA